MSREKRVVLTFRRLPSDRDLLGRVGKGAPATLKKPENHNMNWVRADEWHYERVGRP